MALRTIPFLFALASLTVMAQAQRVPEPPLPGEEGPVSPGEAFSLLPQPGDLPPESAPENLEVDPMPVAPAPEDIPDLPPLVAPDDEEVPDLPIIPGLTPPRSSAPIPRSEALRKTDPAVPGGTPQENTPQFDPTRLAASIYWYPSPRLARQASIELRRPLLLVFTHSTLATSQHFDEDLLIQPDFKELAAGNIILCKLEYSNDSLQGLEVDAKKRRTDALNSFKTYYKVKGFPSAVLFDESGREMTRISGYRRVENPASGEIFSMGDVLLERLKDAMKRWENTRRAAQEKEARLIADGFRLWRSHTGSTLMARLVQARPDGIILMDPEGRRRGVRSSQLMLWDAEWARRKQREYDQRYPSAAPVTE